MLQIARSGAWAIVAAIGILVTIVLSCLWNFSHTYMLAGGENPLLIFEGHWPAWSATALVVGLASVGADLLKVNGGFILFGAFVKKHGWRRIASLALAAVVIIPTMAWSAISAAGMVGLVFGDTIANRGHQKLLTQSVAESLDAAQKRLAWLSEQKTCVGSVCKAHAKEAASLRKELREDRIELRASKSVGAAMPSAQVISDVTGFSVTKLTAWIIALFVVMLEICSCLGLAALGLATSPGKGISPSRDLSDGDMETRDDDDKSERHVKSAFNSRKLNGSNENFNGALEKSFLSSEEMSSAPFPTRDDDKENEEIADEDLDEPLILNKQDSLKRRQRRGRPRMACLGDGHIEAYVESLQEKGVRPDHVSYRDFCRQLYLSPMKPSKMWQGVRRYKRLGRETVRRFFDPGKRAVVDKLTSIANLTGITH